MDANVSRHIRCCKVASLASGAQLSRDAQSSTYAMQFCHQATEAGCCSHADPVCDTRDVLPCTLCYRSELAMMLIPTRLPPKHSGNLRSRLAFLLVELTARSALDIQHQFRWAVSIGLSAHEGGSCSQGDVDDAF